MIHQLPINDLEARWWERQVSLSKQNHPCNGNNAAPAYPHLFDGCNVKLQHATTLRGYDFRSQPSPLPTNSSDSIPSSFCIVSESRESYLCGEPEFEHALAADGDAIDGCQGTRFEWRYSDDESAESSVCDSGTSSESDACTSFCEFEKAKRSQPSPPKDNTLHPDFDRRLPSKMVKKKKSLQSIFVPSFLRDSSITPSSSTSISPEKDSPTGSSSSTRPHFRQRSYTYAHSAGASHIYASLLPAVPQNPLPSPLNLSPSSSIDLTPGRLSPSTYFFDDDPFAKRTAPRLAGRIGSELSPIRKESDVYQPQLRSPLNRKASPTTPPTTPPLPHRPKTAPSSSSDDTIIPENGSNQVSPTRPPLLHSQTVPQGGASLTRSHTLIRRLAHTRPAFTPRPSLPTLSTLARMDMRVPLKKRKGKVGAGLPSEPWEESEAAEEIMSSRSSDEFGTIVERDGDHPKSEGLVGLEVNVEDVDADVGADDTPPAVIRNLSVDSEDYENQARILLSTRDSDPVDLLSSMIHRESILTMSDPDPDVLLTGSTVVESYRNSQTDAYAAKDAKIEAFARSLGLNTSSVSLASSPMESSFRDSMVIDPSWSFPESSVASPMVDSDIEHEGKKDDVLTDLPRLSATNSDVDLLVYSLRRHRSDRSGTGTLLSVSGTSESSRSSSIGSPDEHAEVRKDGNGSQLSRRSDRSYGTSFGSFLEMSGDVVSDEGPAAPRSTMYQRAVSVLRTPADMGIATLRPKKSRELYLDIKSQDLSGNLRLSDPKELDTDAAADVVLGVVSSDRSESASEDVIGPMHAFEQRTTRRMASVIELLDALDPVCSYAPNHGQAQGSDRRHFGNGGGGDSNSNGGSYGDWRGGDWGRSSSSGGPNVPGGSGNGRNGDDDGAPRRPSRPSAVPSSAQASESEEETSASETEDNYGFDSPSIIEDSLIPTAIGAQLRNGRKGVYRRPSSERARDAGQGQRPQNEDDDVPLAQRIPGALVAQKSIRRQVKDERAKKKQERLHIIDTSPPALPVEGQIPAERGRRLTAKTAPQTAGPIAGSSMMSSSQEAAMHAMRSEAPRPTGVVRRHRARTIGEGSASGVPPDDLTRRLLQVQAQTGPSPVHMRIDSSQRHRGSEFEHGARSPVRTAYPNVGELSLDASSNPAVARSHHISPPPPPPDLHWAEPIRPLRTQRSLNFPRRSVSPGKLALVAKEERQLGRSNTTRTRRGTDSNRPVSRDAPPDFRFSQSTRPSLESNRPMVRDSAGMSTEFDSPAHTRASASRPPVPPLPETEVLRGGASRGMAVAPASLQTSALVQTKVFIADMQRFNTIAIGHEMNAKETLEMIRNQGELREDGHPGSWMVWEVSQDFGLERPVRQYELLSDIMASWNAGKHSSVFMIKKSLLAAVLSTMPSSSPKCGSYVRWESKKGKWSKRWLELKEQGLWLSKHEGKAEEFLCSLSGFDAYYVTRIHKAPKPFVFAVKSTESISLFENTADYLHVFACSDENGRKWMESILLARSFLLHKEKQVLFRSNEGAASGSAVGLARAGTRKAGVRPAQTLVAVAPPFGQSAPAPVSATNLTFEPGSLLAKRTAESGI